MPYATKVAIKYLNNSKCLYGEAGLKPETPQAAGMDLRACMEEEYIDISAGERFGFPCGIALNISAACHESLPPLVGFLYSRSGLGAVKGLTVAQGVGVIDPDYRGEVKAFMLNTSQDTIRIMRGERIAQLIFQPYYPLGLQEVEELEVSQRGTGGFGSSGT